MSVADHWRLVRWLQEWLQVEDIRRMGCVTIRIESESTTTFDLELDDMD
jgi:hypothetical protein